MKRSPQEIVVLILTWFAIFVCTLLAVLALLGFLVLDAIASSRWWAALSRWWTGGKR